MNRFEVVGRDGLARTARLTTDHGVIETPAFMPVGTLGAVKGITSAQLREVGASVMLANLYHLSLRPGVEQIEKLGGLHSFTGWDGPILTDSGGYQVFSLSRLRTVDEGGVTFRNHIDGSEMRLTPAGVVDSQIRLGVDVAMVLDECPPWPISLAEAEQSWRRSLRWAEASRQGIGEAETQVFGIVQGSVFRDLRQRAASEITEIGFDGYAIGGVSVGEPIDERRDVVEWTAPVLPETCPRYLMGVGTPADIAHAVSYGVDLFDCVLPSRNGRHGVLYGETGIVRIKNARYGSDPTPLLCGVSRAFLHHLFRAREVTAGVLATLHNLRFYLDFMGDLRDAIASRTVADLAKKFASAYDGDEGV